MYGAILGDIIGEPYEFDRGHKSKSFPLFSSRPTYTDDSVNVTCFPLDTSMTMSLVIPRP